MQQPRGHVAVEKPLREQQRGRGEDVEEARDQEERQVLQVVQLEAPDPLDPLVRARAAGDGDLGLNGILLRSSGERKPPLTCIMRTTVSQDMLAAFRIMSVAAMT